jgi:hypothetical protein
MARSVLPADSGWRPPQQQLMQGAPATQMRHRAAAGPKSYSASSCSSIDGNRPVASVSFGDPQSPARPSARWRHGQPLSTKPFAEGIGVRRVRKAVAHIVLFLIVPSATAPRRDASFAMEGQNIFGLGSEAARGQWQLNDIRIIPLVLSRGDFAFAPGHFSLGVVSFVFHIDVRLEACRQPWAIVGIRHVASWTGYTTQPQPRAAGPSTAWPDAAISGA